MLGSNPLSNPFLLTCIPNLLFLFSIYFFYFYYLHFYLFLFFSFCFYTIIAAAEDLGITRIAGLSWAQWNARLAMPLVAHMQEGAQPLLFNSNETSQSPTNEDKYTDSKVNGLPTQSYPCPDCGRYYKLKSSLRNHQKWECGKEPQFQVSFNFIISFCSKHLT